MRILFLLSSLEMGGAERVGANLCSAWARMGHEVVMMPTFARATRASAFNTDPRVVIKPIADLTGGKSSWPAKVIGLRREIVEGRYDVVCSFLTSVNLLALIAGLGTKCPVVVSERTYPPSFRLGRKLELARRILYPLAAKVVMQTREGQVWLERTIPYARGTVIANPVAFPLPDNQPIKDVTAIVGPGRKVLLGVGRLSEEKRFDWLLTQFASLASEHEDWTLVLLGEGQERGKLQEIIDTNGIEGRVKLVGSTGNLDAWYRRADAFVLASRFEGYPNSLAEAVAYGLPALAVDCPTGPSELVADGENGILLPRCAGDADLRRGLGSLMVGRFPAASKRASELRTRLDVDNIAESWLDIFNFAVTKGSLP